MLFRKKPQEEPVTAYPYGFAVPKQPETVVSGKGLVCLMKGILIFAAAYGTIGGVVSSFQLPTRSGLLFFTLLAFSIVMAFLHYSRFLFNLFYPVIFVGFTYFIFTFRYLVNSGYQAFLNILQQTYGDYYLLDTYRESTEYFSDRSLTITFAAGFIGFFLILLLNIFISEYMSVIAVILLTFPIFQSGLFVEKPPAISYFILLLFSYFMVGILRCSRHFLLPYRDKKWTEFAQTEKNNVVTYRYHASGRLFLQLTGVFLVFTLILGLISLPMMTSSGNSHLSKARRGMDEYMKAFTQNGLSSFFDRYSAKGGISGGKLGGVSSVRPDYETDLNVTFVPTSYNTLYLKAYTGAHYTGNSWDEADYPESVLKETLGDDFENYERFHALLEGNRISLMQNAGKDIPLVQMEIENIDAEQGYDYLPYYVSPDFSLPSEFRHGNIYPAQEKTTYRFSYYPYPRSTSGGQGLDVLFAKLPADDKRKDYLAYISLYDRTSYLEIPESLREYLESLHDDIGTGKDLAEQIELITNYFYENYPYSMTPGTTPMDADFVRYFLETQKRGYCSHFASAGALLLRSYGYPARYIEGYSVSLTDISEGEVLADEEQDEWITGNNPLGSTGVVKVPVTDGSAHAWVEVYVDDFGWIPVEFTPPSDEDEIGNDYSGFWSLFSGIFALSGQEPDTVNNQSQTTELLSEKNDSLNKLLSHSVFKPLIIVLTLLLSGVLCFYFFRALIRMQRMENAYRSGDHAPLISYEYRKLCQKLLARRSAPEDGQEADFILPGKMPALFEDLAKENSKLSGQFSVETITHNMELLEQCLYAKDGIDQASADSLLTFLKAYKKALG